MAFSSATLVAAAARRFSGAGAAGATDAGAAAVPNHPPGDAWAGVVAAAAPLTPPRPATKIVATLGRSSVDDDGALIDALLAAGVSCARLDNSAARGTTFMREQYAALQAAVARAGTLCAVMLDTTGTREATARLAAPLPLAPGAQLSLVAADDGGAATDAGGAGGGGQPPPPPQAADELLLEPGSESFLSALKPGDWLHASRYLSAGGAGSAFLRVTAPPCALGGAAGDGGGGGVRVAVTAHAATGALAGDVTLVHAGPPPGVASAAAAAAAAGGEAPPPAIAAAASASAAAAAGAAAHLYPAAAPLTPAALSRRDRAMLAAFAGLSVDYLALSFAESADQVAEARAALADHGLDGTKVLAKIETALGLANFESILEAADGVVFSRGNLGLSVPLYKLARLQKALLWRTLVAGKPSLLTRVLDTTVDAPRPTRAEATDVANAVLDGLDGIVLGAETDRGVDPAGTVATLAACCSSAEACFDHNAFYYKRMNSLGAFGSPDGGAATGPGLGLRASIASTLVRVAEKTDARLIILFSKSGRYASEVAQWRPAKRVLAVVPPTLVAAEGVRWTVGGRAEASRCALLRGVIPLLADPSEGLSEDTMLRHALATALEAGLVRRSDFVCVSHKLRDDWSISVLCVGSDGADGDAGVAGLGCGGYGPLAGGGDSSASLASLLARTPSAADLRTAGRPDRRRSSRF